MPQVRSKIIISTALHETQIALIEGQQLTELYVERKNQRRIVGNVCKGRVTKVLPGMQAAFVDIGLEKDAFLYVLDVFDHMEELESTILEETEGEEEFRELQQRPAVQRELNGVVSLAIDELLQEGKEVLVQVSKEPLGNKGARVTSHISLPGRYLVHMPTVDHIGVSKRIVDEEERTRLRQLVQGLCQDKGGFIIRTAGEGKGVEEFRPDMEMLVNLWHNIQRRSEKTTAPAVLHRDLDPIFRMVRDLFTPDVDRLIIDSEVEYERLIEYVDTIVPHMTNRVKLYTQSRPIFEEFGIQDEIEQALRRKIWLKSGGYILVEQTEALVAIDVNTGKYVGSRSLEETITKINLEAVREIVRQIRLRDLGGIIVIDFIDMEQEENKLKVFHALEEALKADRARTSISKITELGLIEMTRKRVKQSLGRTLCRPCPYCRGLGMIKSPTTVIYEIAREVLKIAHDGAEKREILIRVNPEIATRMRHEDGEVLDELERMCSRAISIKADEALHVEQYDIVTF